MGLGVPQYRADKSEYSAVNSGRLSAVGYRLSERMAIGIQLSVVSHQLRGTLVTHKQV